MGDNKKRAVLFGPFVGELYWECGRFAPMLPHMINNKYKGKDVTYIVYTREDRFDLYGRNADILVPLEVEGDYVRRYPECFRLFGFRPDAYESMAKRFKSVYDNKYKVIEHIFPSVRKPNFQNKNQFPRRQMLFDYAPRKDNYKLVDEYLPDNGKPLVVLAPRFREGFKRNWKRWPDFYDLLWKDADLRRDYTFIICGKVGEYVPDPRNRFLDMTKIEITERSSLVGILLVILERTHFTFGSQSAIPNISLLYGVEVLEFGCQKRLHTVTYNVKNTPITFIENRKYNLEPEVALKNMKKILERKRRKNDGRSKKLLD